MFVFNSKQLSAYSKSIVRFYLFCFKGKFFITDNAYYQYLAVDSSGAAHIFTILPEFIPHLGIWQERESSSRSPKEVFYVADDDVFGLVKLSFEERRGNNIPDYMEYRYSLCGLDEIFVCSLTTGDLARIINSGIPIEGAL